MENCLLSESEEKTKSCFKCGIIKPLSGFYKHPQMRDGHLNKCKECSKKDVSANYRRNIDHFKEYEHRRAKNRWDYISEQSKKWRLKNPQKYAAHIAVGNAVRDGRIEKQPCFICGSTDVHAHHHDYSRPLDVIWVCAQHHKWLHSKEAA